MIIMEASGSFGDLVKSLSCPGPVKIRLNWQRLSEVDKSTDLILLRTNKAKRKLCSEGFHIFQQWVPAALPTWYLPLLLVFVPLVATVALGVLVGPLEKDAIQLKLEAILLVPNWIMTMVECEVYADKDTYPKTKSESDGPLHCKHNMYKHTRILWGEKWTIWTLPMNHLKVTMPYWEARPGQQLHASRPWFGPCACDFRVMPMNYLWLFSRTPVTLLYVSR